MCTYLLPADNGVYYFRRGIPAKLRPFLGGKREIKVSLGTKDRETAKRLIPDHTKASQAKLDQAQAAYDAATATPAPPALPKSQAKLDRERALWERDEENAAYFSAEADQADAELESLEPIMDALVAGQVPNAPASDVARAARLAILHERDIAADEREKRRNDAMTRMAAYAVTPNGDGKGQAEQKTTDAGLRIMALFDRFAASGTANPKTVKKWRGRVANLIEHLGHDDASRVTRADLNAWTEKLVAKGLAQKTIVDGYLPAVRAALGIAHDDELIPANPASALKVRAPKVAKLRDRDLTDSEAETILRATLAPQPAGLAEKHALARRWVPWLCAYTGARVGEITQLRACDIQQQEGTWFIRITPEAGSVKTGKARSVPLHSHLIEQGFVKLAKAGDTAPLFYREGAGNEVNPASKIRAADLAKWVRTLGVKAPQPNHGWRHRFKTLARLYGITDAIADAIQGHAEASEGRKYGSVPLPVMKEAIEKLPRYKV